MSSSSKEGAGVAPQNKGSWFSFLKSIKSAHGDLSSLTAPPFILGTTSLTEFSAYWTEHPSIFVAPASELDPAKRALLVLKWFLSTLKQQYSSRSDKFGSEKKPLNPFLGELFLGHWMDEAGSGETELYSEQVSHHPPVTAYYIRNKNHGMELQGYNAQKVTFSSTIHVQQIGHALLEIASFKETYLITLPSLHIESLLYGPYVELNKTSYITSSSGYVAKIDYSGKGWVSGTKNSFAACLYPAAGKDKKPLYTIDGQWTDTFTIRDGSGKTLEIYKATKTTPLIVAPLEKQDPYESNRAWNRVAAAIIEGDMKVVSAEKGKIEEAQRKLRQKEKSEGREWARRYFNRMQKCPVFEELAKPVGERIEKEMTDGVWRFDTKKADRSKPSFQEGQGDAPANA
ncbi:Oxysterol binding protein [Pseudocyphellaria aurata]|nr:Oxysterol binding protein [Pseudocyphellaria aurata]